MQLPFTSTEFAARLALVRAAMARDGVDVLLVNKPENIYYLSGYETHGFFWCQVLVVAQEGEPYFIIRSPEASNIRHTSLYQRFVGYRDHECPITPTVAGLKDLGVRRVGMEPDSWFITPAQYGELVAAAPNVDFVDCSDLVDEIRCVKSPAEIAYTEAAAVIADATVKAGLESIAEASTDRDINAAVLAKMVLAGSEYPALWPFVTSGPATERFHVSWSGQPVVDGDLVYMHLGGVVRRYLGAVGRTGARGRVSAKLADRHKILIEAQAEGIAAMRPGMTAAQAYHGFARIVKKAGYGLLQGGYAIGINFPPRWPEWRKLRLNEGCDTVLTEGMVFHTPISIREPGEQTPIVSNTVVLEKGGARLLTHHPEDLFIA